MNLYTNNKSYGLMSTAEKDIVGLIPREEFLAFYQGEWQNWNDVPRSQYQDVTIRLHDGEIFGCYIMTIIESGAPITVMVEDPSLDDEGLISAEVEYFDNGDTCDKSSRICHVEDVTLFRPATVMEAEDWVNRQTEKEEEWVDVEINWKDGMSIEHPCGQTTHEFRVGFPDEGWFLSGFVFEGDDNEYESPAHFTNKGKKIKEKATHARYVMEEN